MKELNYSELGQRIRFKRKESQITQEQLSELIDVCPSYISEIERGYSIPSLSTIYKISIQLHCSLDYLVFGITPDNANDTFKELIKSIPENNRDLYINLCTKITESLK